MLLAAFSWFCMFLIAFGCFHTLLIGLYPMAIIYPLENAVLTVAVVVAVLTVAVLSVKTSKTF